MDIPCILLVVGSVVKHFGHGVEDCWQGAFKAVQLFKKSPLARKRFRNLFILNGLLIFSADLLIQLCSDPIVRYPVGGFFHLIDLAANTLHFPSPQLGVWVDSNCTYMAETIVMGLRALWIIPVFLLAKPVNVFWYQDIANEAHRESAEKGKTRSRTGLTFALTLTDGLGPLLADLLYSVVLSIFFMIQTGLALYVIQSWVSIHIGSVVYFVHQALLSALFSCEYRWYSRGNLLAERITTVENNWPYYMGFGASLATLTLANLSVMASSALYAAVLPLCIVGGTLTTRKVHCGVRRFPIFTLSVWCCRLIFVKILTKKGTSNQPCGKTCSPVGKDDSMNR